MNRSRVQTQAKHFDLGISFALHFNYCYRLVCMRIAPLISFPSSYRLIYMNTGHVIRYACPQLALWIADMSSIPANSVTCSICLEHWVEPTECLPCRHIFCKKCISRVERCPLCRSHIREMMSANRFLLEAVEGVVGHDGVEQRVRNAEERAEEAEKILAEIAGPFLETDNETCWEAKARENAEKVIGGLRSQLGCLRAKKRGMEAAISKLEASKRNCARGPDVNHFLQCLSGATLLPQLISTFAPTSTSRAAMGVAARAALGMVTRGPLGAVAGTALGAVAAAAFAGESSGRQGNDEIDEEIRVKTADLRILEREIENIEANLRLEEEKENRRQYFVGLIRSMGQNSERGMGQS